MPSEPLLRRGARSLWNGWPQLAMQRGTRHTEGVTNAFAQLSSSIWMFGIGLPQGGRSARLEVLGLNLIEVVWVNLNRLRFCVWQCGDVQVVVLVIYRTKCVTHCGSVLGNKQCGSSAIPILICR
jgi:hypothetical protein